MESIIGERERTLYVREICRSNALAKVSCKRSSGNPFSRKKKSTRRDAVIVTNFSGDRRAGALAGLGAKSHG